jgi:hypothetical protein
VEEAEVRSRGLKRRVLTSGVPDKAKRFFAEMDGLVQGDMAYIQGVADSTAGYSLMLLDFASGEVIRGFSWSHFCRFDVRLDGDFQVIGFNWFEGSQTIEERLGEGAALRNDELELWYLYVWALPEFYEAALPLWERLSVPENMYESKSLLG